MINDEPSASGGASARRITDPPLTTRDMADWLGVSIDYVYGELIDGKIPFEDVARSGTRKEYRVRLSDFVAYLTARGYKRLPTLADFSLS